MKTCIIKRVDDKGYNDVMSFIWSAISKLNESGVKDEEIKVFIPDYFTNVLMMYLESKVTNTDIMTKDHDHYVYGIKILTNHSNTIVVSYKDAMLYDSDLLEFEIPPLKEKSIPTDRKQHDLACKYIRDLFDATFPHQWDARAQLIEMAKEAELSPEFIQQLEKDL